MAIPITKDTWVSAKEGEKFGNNGSEKKLKLKGQQEITLVDFDVSTLKQKVIDHVFLHVKSLTPARAPIMRLGASSVATEWKEGNGREYRKEFGSACFSQSQYKMKDWAYPGSDVLDSIFGKGNTLWRFADCTTPDNEGWQKCAIQPEVLSARIAGISHGICLMDEVGSVWSLQNGKFNYSYFPNRFFCSRETKSAPWLEVSVSGCDRIPPDAIGHIDIQTKGFPTGEAMATWRTPPDSGGGKTIGFLATYEKAGKIHSVPRYLVPMAGQTGLPVRMHLQDLEFSPGEQIVLYLQAVDSGGNVGPKTSSRFTIGQKIAFPDRKVKPELVNTSLNVTSGGTKETITVLGVLDKVDLLTGRLFPTGGKASNSSFGFDVKQKRIRLNSARNETVWFQLLIENYDNEVLIEYTPKDKSAVELDLYKIATVPFTDNGVTRQIPDPLLPLECIQNENTMTWTLLSPEKRVSFLVELYVPHNENTGFQMGSFVVKSGDQVSKLNIELNVWDFSLPDKLSFIPEMNAYWQVSPYSGYEYYILAHENRTCLNRLPYGWDGIPEFAPSWTGEDYDWKRWDYCVGPLLDGSAFKGNKRNEVPVDVMYLPVSENWPINIHSNFLPSYWVEEALSEKYQNQLKIAFSKFGEHIRDKAWKETIFQFYLNNKIYYREEYPNSTAPWILDEPVNTQDFWALRWYGRCWQEAVAPFRKDVSLWFRADISYSQYARNQLWGVLDAEYIGGISKQKIRMKEDEYRLWEPSHHFEYGSVNDFRQENTQPVLWCLSAWSNGADGVLPWQTIGNENSWKQADQNALFYPHPQGPRSSIRLKAFTYGQQLVEYLTIFSDIYKVPRYLVSDWLSNEFFINRTIQKEFENDAGTPLFDKITPFEIRNLKLQLGAMISVKSPPYRKTLKDFPKDIPANRVVVELGHVRQAKKIESMKPICGKNRF